MSSTPFTPASVWQPGTTQPSMPVNDNALRVDILAGLVLSKTTTAQPASPAEGAIYIIPPAATGAQWAAFTANDLAIHYGGTWYAFAPVEGLVVRMASGLQVFTGGAWAAGYNGEPVIAPGTAAQYWRGDKTWQDLAADVRAAPLTGLSTATSAAITAADTLLAALGKLQAQITTLDGAAVKTAGAQSVAGVKTFTDALRVADGTAAAPSVAAASDSNTGLRWLGSDQLGLVAAGVDQAIVNTRGVVAAVGKLLATSTATGDEFRLEGARGLSYKPHAVGWARGWFVRNVADTADLGGFGFTGTGDTISRFAVGYGSTWWSPYVFALTPSEGVFTVPLRLGQYTLTTLPSASAFSGYFIDVTNATGGPKLCRSNGTAWQIANTTTTVS